MATAIRKTSHKGMALKKPASKPVEPTPTVADQVAEAPETEITKKAMDWATGSTSEKKPGRGRPATGVKKRKVTFDLEEGLIADLDKVAKSYGVTRAAFISQSVMKAVREAFRTERL